MSPDQIIEYARRERYRVVVTEQMIIAAVKELVPPFTCRDVVAALPRDDRGSSPSEYLVTLWIENFVDRGLVRWTGAASPRTYAALPDLSPEPESQGRDRLHCGTLSYDLGHDVEWCPVCGALRVNGKCGERWIEPRKVRDER
jgi:hypothetical protein